MDARICIRMYVCMYVCMYVHTCVCQMSRSGGNLVVNVVVRKKELVTECTSGGKRLTHRLQGSRKHAALCPCKSYVTATLSELRMKSLR